MSLDSPPSITPESPFGEIMHSMRSALETYSNVHRGSGHHSMVTTHLYEQARKIVLDHLGLDHGSHTVIFCSPRSAGILQAHLGCGNCTVLSSDTLGLALGVRALAVKRKTLTGWRTLTGSPSPIPTGGGTARLISRNWVVWAATPDRFEAGTPPVINIIAFAKALQLAGQNGNGFFPVPSGINLTTADILLHDDLEQSGNENLSGSLRNTLIGRDVQVPSAGGPVRFINLDNAASTPTFEPVFGSVVKALSLPAEIQRELIREVRSLCAGFLKAPETQYDILFTTNTTESINIAAESLGKEIRPGEETVIVNTLLEHNSNDLPWRLLPGVTMVRLMADGNGFLNPGDLEAVLKEYNSNGSVFKRNKYSQ